MVTILTFIHYINKESVQAVCCHYSARTDKSIRLLSGFDLITGDQPRVRQSRGALRTLETRIRPGPGRKLVQSRRRSGRWSAANDPTERAQAKCRPVIPCSRALWLDESGPAAHNDVSVPSLGSREFFHFYQGSSSHTELDVAIERDIPANSEHYSGQFCWIPAA